MMGVFPATVLAPTRRSLMTPEQVHHLLLYFLYVAFFEVSTRKLASNGRLCYDSSECSPSPSITSQCYAQLTKEQEQMYKDKIDFKAVGRCDDGDHFGCFPIVANGTVSGRGCR